MNVLFIVLTSLILIAAVLLTIVVLLQNGKGQGLASNFVAGNQTFGVRQTADILEKTTWVLVVFIFVLSVIASFTTGSTSTSIDVTNQIENVATQQQPEFPTAPIESEAPTEAPVENPAN